MSGNRKVGEEEDPPLRGEETDLGGPAKRFRRSTQNIRRDEVIIKELAFTAPTGKVRSLASSRRPATDPDDGEGDGAGDGRAGPSEMHAPKVRFDAEGRLIVDQQSLQVGVGGDARHSNPHVTHQNRASRSSVIHRRVRPMDKWSAEESERFFELLALYGCDFSLIAANLVNRTRTQVKNKFKKEEADRPDRVDRALKFRTPV